MTNFVKQLKYELPKSNTEALFKLASVLDIPKHHIQGDHLLIAQSMAGTILYRSLDNQSKQQVMRLISRLSSGHLKSRLIAKCTDVLVNPQWGEWSLTTSELKEVLQLHNDFNRWSSLLGANPGAYGVGGSAWSIIKQGASTGNVVVLIVSIALIGIHEFSYKETQKYAGELERRK